MEITKELLQTIYDRTVQVSLAKFNSEPHQIHLEENGSITLEWTIHCYGDTDYEYETIKSDELNSDLDALIKERKEKEEIAKIEAENKKKEQEKIRLAILKEQEYKRYLELKKKFES